MKRMCYKKKSLRHFQGNSRTLNIHFKHSLSALASLSLVLFDQSFLAFRCLFSLFVNLLGRPLPWFLCLHCILHLSSYFFAYPRLCLASISFSTLYLPTSVSRSCLSWPFFLPQIPTLPRIQVKVTFLTLLHRFRIQIIFLF